MRYFLLAITYIFLFTSISAQTRLQVINDSVRINNGELIIRNSTKDVPGYLYNTGNGLTQFRPLDLTNLQTPLTVPKIIGGNTATSSLTLQPTDAVGTTGSDIILNVGDNGNKEALRIDHLGNIGINGRSSGARLELTANNLGQTPSPVSGINLVNTTPATANLHQVSPGIKWSSQGWRTSIPGSFYVDWMAYALPVDFQNLSNPSGTWVLSYQTNGAGYTDLMTVNRGGNLSVTGNITGNNIVANDGTISTSSSFNSSIFAASTNGAHYGSANQLIAGATTTSRVAMALGSSINIPSNNNYAHSFIASGTVKEASSGTHALFTSLAVKPLVVTNDAASLTNAATVYIDDAPTAGTNNYSLWVAGSGSSRFDGKILFASTNTPAGTIGSQTINLPSGSVNIGTGDRTLVVSNAMVTTSSIIMLTIEANDSNATSAYISEKSSGSFTIKLNAAAAAETRVNFIVFN